MRRRLIHTSALGFLIGAALAAGVLWARNAASPERPQQRVRPPATQPGSESGEAEYPSDELMEACERRARELAGELDETFAMHVRPPFVAAGNFPAGRLERLVARSVVRPAEAMWAGYFDRRPDKVITVLLFADEDSYRGWAKKLFGDEDVSYFGYYRGRERTLVMNIATGTGTLVHELTHALIVYDFPDVPTWFNEGFASLHEQCRVGDDDITGLVNWRLGGLQAAIEADRLRPLRRMIVARDFYGPLRGVNYAQARYFVMYVQKRGRLKNLYAALRKAYADADEPPEPTADVEVVERVLGRDVDDVERDMIAWVGRLEFPPGR